MGRWEVDMGEEPRWQHRGRGDSSGEPLHVQRIIAHQGDDYSEVAKAGPPAKQRRRLVSGRVERRDARASGTTGLPDAPSRHRRRHAEP